MADQDRDPAVDDAESYIAVRWVVSEEKQARLEDAIEKGLVSHTARDVFVKLAGFYSAIPDITRAVLRLSWIWAGAELALAWPADWQRDAESKCDVYNRLQDTVVDARDAAREEIWRIVEEELLPHDLAPFPIPEDSEGEEWKDGDGSAHYTGD